MLKQTRYLSKKYYICLLLKMFGAQRLGSTVWYGGLISIHPYSNLTGRGGEKRRDKNSEKSFYFLKNKNSYTIFYDFCHFLT